MGEINGIEGEVWICTAGGAKAKLLRVASWSLNQECDELDKTSTDSAGNKGYLPGMKESTIDVKARWETTEGKVVGAPPVLDAGALVDFSLYVDKANYPNLEWSGTGFVKSGPKLAMDYAGGEAFTYEFTIRVDGDLTVPASH